MELGSFTQKSELIKQRLVSHLTLYPVPHTEVKVLEVNTCQGEIYVHIWALLPEFSFKMVLHSGCWLLLAR